MILKTDSLVAKLKTRLVSDLFVWNQAFSRPQDCGSDLLSLYIFIFSVSVFFSILSVYCFIFFLFNEIFTSLLIKKKKKEKESMVMISLNQRSLKFLGV